jgi:hypothetical protein
MEVWRMDSEFTLKLPPEARLCRVLSACIGRRRRTDSALGLDTGDGVIRVKCKYDTDFSNLPRRGRVFSAKVRRH